jgi:hypothetical protein
MSEERERERDRSPEKHSDFKVFVGGISWHTTDQELADSEPLMLPDFFLFPSHGNGHVKSPG